MFLGGTRGVSRSEGSLSEAGRWDGALGRGSTAALVWFVIVTGIQHRRCPEPPHELPGQLPQGLHAHQPGAAQDLLQADVCVCHVHQLHAGVCSLPVPLPALAVPLPAPRGRASVPSVSSFRP